MGPAKMADAARNLGGFLREEGADFGRSRLRPQRPELDDRGRQALADLRRDGFAVVPDYWPRERAVEVRDALRAELAGDGDARLDDSGALRVRNRRDHRYDQGVARIYHVDRLRPDLAELREDPFALGVARAYFGIPIYGSNLMYQHNTPNPDFTTRYFHVDCFTKELKAFLYLDDIDLERGPFTYIRRSHRWRGRRLWRFARGNPSGDITSFSAQDIGERHLQAETPLTAGAGSLILADVRGLHRGLPQLSGDRSVAVLYMTKHRQIDLEAA